MQIPQALVDALRRSEPGAFDEFVHATHGVVYTLAYRITGNSEDAKDVTQEVFIRAWRGLKNFRGESNLGTWLHRITVNCALSAVRRRGRRPIPTDAQRLPDSIVEPADATDREVLETALRTLSDQDRIAVVLKDVEGWTCEEIARKLGTTEGAVKVRLFRARQRLADRLAAQGVVVPMKRRTPRPVTGGDGGQR